MNKNILVVLIPFHFDWVDPWILFKMTLSLTAAFAKWNLNNYLQYNVCQQGMGK